MLKSIPFSASLALAAALACGAAHASELRLDNGLRVVVRERPGSAVVKVEVAYPAGSAVEPDSLAGVAHVAEHLLCEGEVKRRLALCTVEHNAHTSPAEMTFVTACLPALLPAVLDAEARRLREAAVDSATFARERAVVQEELSYRGGHLRSSPAIEAFRISFPDHPYGRDVGGTPESVRRLAPADVRAFVADHIRPNGASITVTGPVAADTVFSLVRARFDDLPRGAPAPVFPPYPMAAAAQSILDDPDHEDCRLAAATRVTLASVRDLALLDLALACLAHEEVGASCTLLPGEAVVVRSAIKPYRKSEAGWWYDEHRLDPDQDAQNLLTWQWTDLHDAVRQIGKSSRRAEWATWRADIPDGDRAFDAAEWLARLPRGEGTPLPTVSDYELMFSSLSLDDVCAFLDQNFTPARTAVVVSHGSDSGRLVGHRLAGRVARQDIDAIDAISTLGANEIDSALASYRGALRLATFRLGNGIALVCAPALGTSDWSLSGWRRFAPPECERADKLPGLCRLYGRVTGIDPRPVQEVQPLRRWPCALTFDVASDGTMTCGASGRAAWPDSVARSLAGRFAEKQFNTTAWWWALEFGERDFARVRFDPASRAASWRLAQILGDDQAALSDWRPEARTLERVRYQDLEKLHRVVTGESGQLTLLAFGGIAPDSSRAVVERAFGSRNRCRPWSPGPPPSGPPAVVGTIIPAASEQDVELVLDFPVRAASALGDHPGLALLWLQEYVHQALDSRLRQRGGWTYSATCSIRPVAGWALAEVHLTCQPGQAPAVLAAARSELAALATGEVSVDLAARARLAVAGRLVRSADDADEMTAWLRRVTAFEAVGDDPLAELLTLPAEQLPSLVATMLPADRFAFSAVGAILEDELELFGR